MKNSIKAIIYIFIIGSLSSCFTERIELDLNQGNKKLVVTAWLTDEDVRQEILLNYTSAYLDVETPEVEDNAIVEITTGEEMITLESVGDGRYLCPLDWRGVPRSVYTLNIEIGEESYTATNTMRVMPPGENIHAVPWEYDDDEEDIEEQDTMDIYALSFSFQEILGEGDGYYGVDYLKGTAIGDTLDNGGFIDDEFIDGEYFDDIVLSSEPYVLGDTVILRLHSIGKDASRYLQDIMAEAFREGLFDPPPVNVRSNISNDAVGYFITSSVYVEEVIITE